MELLNVTAVIVTRGNVSLEPIRESLPAEWRIVVWDNSRLEDLSVFGRYAALSSVGVELVYVQDDDVIVSNPRAIVDAWEAGHVVCNMPSEYRAHYSDSALVGFGACFQKWLPHRAFDRFKKVVPTLGLSNYGWYLPPAERFRRECDTVFTTLTPRILVDVPKTDREFASDPDRLWKQPDHVEQRQRMLELARQVRDSV